MEEVGGRKGLPKLRDLLRRQRTDSDVMNDTPDLDFAYEDADVYQAEIAELYSYTEEPELQQNQKYFEEGFSDRGRWVAASELVRRKHVVDLQNELEVADKERRTAAVRSILYLCQGNFADCETEEEQAMWARNNVFLLYEVGIFSSFVELLSMEVENSTAASSALRKPAVSVADSAELRFIINVLYTMVETMRVEEENDSDEQKKLREMFKTDLSQSVIGEEILPVTLFNMVTRFCSGSAPHFPMKKVLLLLWKVVLVSLGGLRRLQETKNEVREMNGLPPLPEDTYEVCKNMRASSPPANAADLIEQQIPRSHWRGGKRTIEEETDKGQTIAKCETSVVRKIQISEMGQNISLFDNAVLVQFAVQETDVSLMKQNSLDEQFDTLNGGDEDLMKELETARGSDDELPPTPPRPSTPSVAPKSLPWKPKVRQKDLEMFLDHTRAKFVGFQVRTDHSSLAGLPHPIHEGVKVLKQHLYTSLSELQVKEEEAINRNPLSKHEKEIVETPAEILYTGMLPSLPQYMIALLKILLAAAPTSKAKTDSINILADVLPEEMPTTVLQSMKLGIDVNRHKEIIVKAISGLLLLLLKHFKLNHIYQFEFMSQHLVFANCIPLVLKFFNQNIMSYVGAKNSIPLIDFPCCVIGEPPELTAENLENGENQAYCWRNLFSCINLLRILNKLTKWKHSRTMMLVVFKSAPILKRALKVKHAMMQLYVLKLLKMQTKYLGRQWRKSNMKTMSAIYQKVRHRLNDDWAYGNDMDARPWDFQAEECALRACVDRFNNRRYGNNGMDPEFNPVDNCILSVLGENIELSDEFKRNYEIWLDMEVFSNQIDWDQILLH